MEEGYVKVKAAAVSLMSANVNGSDLENGQTTGTLGIHWEVYADGRGGISGIDWPDESLYVSGNPGRTNQNITNYINDLVWTSEWEQFRTKYGSCAV